MMPTIGTLWLPSRKEQGSSSPRAPGWVRTQILMSLRTFG
jgi:hypothetical protein